MVQATDEETDGCSDVTSLRVIFRLEAISGRKKALKEAMARFACHTVATERNSGEDCGLGKTVGNFSIMRCLCQGRCSLAGNTSKKKAKGTRHLAVEGRVSGRSK